MNQVVTLLISGTLLALTGRVTADEPLVVDVWPSQAPGETVPIDAEKLVERSPFGVVVKGLTNVSRPTITIFRHSAKSDTAAVLVCPGGGYNIIPWELEGAEPAAWLNSLGVTAIVLKYRVPRRTGQPADRPPLGPLQDAQRALSLVRSRASQWGIDPSRIGILGFSAGGHLTASVATGFDRRTYEAVDEVDQASCRPDFAVLVYPGGLLTNETGKLRSEIRVRSECPPMFLVHADDDPVRPDNSLLFYAALKSAGVPAELHIFASGGHGFAMRSTQPCSAWPQLCAAWLESQGFLSADSRHLKPVEEKDAHPGRPVSSR